MTKPEYIQCCNTLIKYHRARPMDEASTQEEKDVFQRMIDYLKYKATNAASIHEPASERPMLQEQIETLYTRFNQEAAADDASYITKLNIFSYQYVMLFTKVIQGADLTQTLKKKIKEIYIPLLLTMLEKHKDDDNEISEGDYESLLKQITDVDIDTVKITDIPSPIAHFIHHQLSQQRMPKFYMDKLEGQGVDRELQILEGMIYTYNSFEEGAKEERAARVGERFGFNLHYTFRDCDYADWILLLDIDIWAARELPYTAIKAKFASEPTLGYLLNRNPGSEIYLTVALDELTLDDLLVYSFDQVFLCGIIYKNQFTDGDFIYPIEFLWHDIIHGNDFNRECNVNLHRDMRDISAFYSYCKRTIPDVKELDMVTLMLFLEFHEIVYSKCNYTTDIRVLLGPGRNAHENTILKLVEEAFFRKTEFYGLIPPEFLDQEAPNNSVYRIQHGNFGRNLPRIPWNEGATKGRIRNYLKQCVRHYFTKHIEWHHVKQDLGRNHSPNRSPSRSYSSPKNHTRKRGRART